MRCFTSFLTMALYEPEKLLLSEIQDKVVVYLATGCAQGGLRHSQAQQGHCVYRNWVGENSDLGCFYYLFQMTSRSL
jgi:hypothetical protein